jgi:hypothetical protein
MYPVSDTDFIDAEEFDEEISFALGVTTLNWPLRDFYRDAIDFKAELYDPCNCILSLSI